MSIERVIPKISIIVAVYNTEREYFRQCMKSLLEQSLKELEIILIDDGSKKECAELCDEYAAKDDRIIVLHKKNEGVSIASNTGIEMASGRYITFVDHDDWIDKDMCKKAYEKIEKTDSDVAIWNYNSYCKDSCKKAYYKGKKQVIYNQEEMSKLQAQIIDVFAFEEQQISLLGANWCKLYKTELLKENKDARFPEHMMGGEDAIFTYKALGHAKRAVFFNEALYYYRQNEHSYTKRFKPDMLGDELRLIRMYQELVKGNDELECCVGKTICNSLITICSGFLFHKENRMTYGQKRKFLKDMIRLPEYQAGLSRIQEYHFNKMKKLCLYSAKRNMVDIVLLLTYVYARKNQEEKFE